MKIARIIIVAAATMIALLIVPLTASAARPTDSGDGSVTVSVKVTDGVSLTQDDNGQLIGKYLGKSGAVVTQQFMIDGVLTIITMAL